MNTTSDHRAYPWLETLLALAVVSLVFQLFPTLHRYYWNRAVWGLDPRNWSPLTCFLINLAVVAILLTWRYGSAVMDGFREQRRRKATERAHAVEKRQRENEQHQLEEQRKLFQRMHEARKRQVF